MPSLHTVEGRSGAVGSRHRFTLSRTAADSASWSLLRTSRICLTVGEFQDLTPLNVRAGVERRGRGKPSGGALSGMDQLLRPTTASRQSALLCEDHHEVNKVMEAHTSKACVMFEVKGNISTTHHQRRATEYASIGN